MALIREVFPIPESPATSTFRRPMTFPASVKGRRLGILMLGMMSWGALPLSIILCDGSLSASQSILRAWLSMSSKRDPDREFLLDETLLRADAGPEIPIKLGVMGWDRFAELGGLKAGEPGPGPGILLPSCLRASGEPLELEGLPSFVSLSIAV